MLEKYYRDALSNNESKSNQTRHKPFKFGNNKQRWQDLEFKLLYIIIYTIIDHNGIC